MIGETSLSANVNRSRKSHLLVVVGYHTQGNKPYLCFLPIRAEDRYFSCINNRYSPGFSVSSRFENSNPGISIPARSVVVMA